VPKPAAPRIVSLVDKAAQLCVFLGTHFHRLPQPISCTPVCCAQQIQLITQIYLLFDTTCNMSAISNTDYWLSDDLYSVTKSGKLRQTPTPTEDTATDSQCNFLSFLRIAQSLEINFLSITLQPKLDIIDQGGTAKIRQAMVNLQMNFAFKRLASPERVQVERGEAKIFRAFIAEMLVLSHPSLRNHPNVIRLKGICWDVVSGGEKVWPVLVFEKARNGDLLTFMGRAEGRSLIMVERLNICVDIAMAVMHMHSSSK
jgi:hypothetical protein